MPKVSVIIPTHNRADLLPRAVSSVLAQTYQDYEIIIVDDGSSDNTPEVVAAFCDPRIRSFRHKSSRGASSARNTGIGDARGEYIAFVDDDDEWLPTKLENQVSLLDASSPKVGLIYGWLDVVEDSSGRIMQGARKTMSGDIFSELLALNVPAPTSTLLVRSSVIRDVGCFDESLPRRDDADFIVRISQHYQVEVLPEVVVKFHVEHGHSRISDNTPKGLSHEIEFIKGHIAKFSRELNSHPLALATLLRELSLAEMMLPNLRAAVSEFATAVRLDPANRINLSHFLLLIKLFFWYATPLSGFRNRARTIRDKFRQQFKT